MTVPDVRAQLGTDFTTFEGLLNQLVAKRLRNRLRQHYYDSKNLYRDLGIGTPPHMRSIEVALGWPAKGVDQLSRRVKHDGFVLPGSDFGEWGIAEMWSENRMAIEAPQAHTSAMIHSCAFVVTTLGDVASGEPEVMMSVFDAMSSTAAWSPLRRGLSSWLGVIRAGEDGSYERIVFLTPQMAYSITKDGQRWDVRRLPHALGRVPVEPLVYRPSTDRPFGRSKVSRAVMYFTDAAMRTLVRSEVGAEFFSAPQRYLLGAEEDAFIGPNGEQRGQWEAVVGRILAIERDEDGNIPQVGQFAQISMQPHTEQLRQWAALFASEVNLPVSSLGIIHDQPASAEAIYAVKEELITEAETAAEVFTPAWTNAVKTGVQMRDRLSSVPTELRSLGIRWRDPALLSKAQNTDATMKQVEAGVLPAESDVTLEQLGYDDTTIQRIQADRRRLSGQRLAQALIEATADDVAV